MQLTTIFLTLAAALTANVADAFAIPSVGTQRQSFALKASSTEDNADTLFKAGLLANCEDDAAQLAAKKIRSIKDLGWNKPAKRRGNTRPRHWAFGGANEKPVQLKPNYDESASNCVEKWLSLKDFYSIVKDDTPVADTIFVALAGGGAFIEREVAETTIAKWRDGRQFDTAAFRTSVTQGRSKFLQGWALFVGATGLAVSGIVFPTNPFQLFLVDLLEQAFHSDATLAELAELKELSMQ
eukprot:CAMPEP_0198117486 /NCGR_PEP_ID=MMETSP1442-20131203/18242_1 /TAXON_ID= /ORGANISM="Craspedostauros australis, Strain CCMP3328" /LENGTH=239 /DNA_ID=CAMNT_0043775543 /DNA_START=94 /DNA_END=813 /DNA_ORIENTATION=-